MVTPLLSLSLLALGTPQEVVDLPVADELLCTEFDESFRIGDDLTAVASIGFDASGTVRIGDATAAGGFRVIAVRPDGDRFEFGRKGQGPGEFAGAASVAALANGHSIVPDYGRDVFHEYLPNGRFRRQVRMDDLADALDLIYRADRIGGLLGQFRTGRTRKERDPETLTTAWRHVEGPREVVRIDLKGGEAQVSSFATGWTPSRPAFTNEETMRFVDGGYTTDGTITRVAFLPRLLWDALPDGGVAMSDSSAYAIKILDSDGQVARIIRRPLPSRAIAVAMQEACRSQELKVLSVKMIGLLQGDPEDMALVENLFKGEEDMERRAIETMEFADELPVVDDLLTSWDGTVWVRRTPKSDFPFDLSSNPSGRNLQRFLQDSQANRPPAPIDLVTSVGEYLGTIPEGRWPAALGPDGRVAYIEVDDLDVPTVLIGQLSVRQCGG